MDIQFWIGLIIIVLTLIARARKQKQKSSPQEEVEGDRPDRQERQSPRPLTFEELLKEIQSVKEEREVVEPAKPYRQPPVYRQPEPAYGEVVDYDDNIDTEERERETLAERRKTVDIYENAKQQAFARPSLEETMKLEDTVIRFGQFKGYESHLEAAPKFDFAAEMRDPQSLKRAFVMSEILKTKF